MNIQCSWGKKKKIYLSRWRETLTCTIAAIEKNKRINLTTLNFNACKGRYCEQEQEILKPPEGAFRHQGKDDTF